MNVFQIRVAEHIDSSDKHTQLLYWLIHLLTLCSMNYYSTWIVSHRSLLSLWLPSPWIHRTHFIFILTGRVLPNQSAAVRKLPAWWSNDSKRIQRRGRKGRSSWSFAEAIHGHGASYSCISLGIAFITEGMMSICIRNTKHNYHSHVICLLSVAIIT